MLSEEEYQKRIQELKNKKFTNLYFIHIPKTAGSYVRNFPIPISAHGNHEQFHSHSPVGGPWASKERIAEDPSDLLKRGEVVSGYKKIDEAEWIQRSLKFATIRNPFDYLISCYFSGMVGAPFKTLLCETDHNDARIRCTKCKGDGYEKFLIKYAKGEALYLQSRKNLFHQIFDDDGRCRVDLLIRTEHISEGLEQLNEIVFCENKISNFSKEPTNISQKRNKKIYKDFYTEETKKVIQEKVKKELDMFGYSFDGPVDGKPFVFLDRDKKYDIF